ncbi:MAG: hypothetical protein JNK72_15160 [Myxococcales bacterium]|nr:hypothetical protein [Myxococcales bacterium]
MTLSWLESSERLTLSARAVADDAGLGALVKLGLLRAEVGDRVACSACWRGCVDLPVMGDTASLSVAPRHAQLVVLCPFGEWDGALPIERLSAGRQWQLSRRVLVEALRRDNALGPVEPRDAPPGVTRLGVTRYLEHCAEVLFVYGLSGADAPRALRGLRYQSGHDLVVLSPDALLSESDRSALAQEGVVYLSLASMLARSPPSLRIPWVWPRLRSAIFSDPNHPAWLCHDVEIAFAEGETGHVVMVQGEPSRHFEKSDVAFAQLLRLAAARAGLTRVGPGGFVDKEKIDPDPKQKGLDDLRARLLASMPPNRQVTGRQLIKTNGDGSVWLPFLPENLHFDASLKRYRSCLSVRRERAQGETGRRYREGLELGQRRASQLVAEALAALARSPGGGFTRAPEPR